MSFVPRPNETCAEAREGDLMVYCECGAVRPVRSVHGQIDTPRFGPMPTWAAIAVFVIVCLAACGFALLARPR